MCGMAESLAARRRPGCSWDQANVLAGCRDDRQNRADRSRSPTGPTRRKFAGGSAAHFEASLIDRANRRSTTSLAASHRLCLEKNCCSKCSNKLPESTLRPRAYRLAAASSDDRPESPACCQWRTFLGRRTSPIAPGSLFAKVRGCRRFRLRQAWQVCSAVERADG